MRIALIITLTIAFVTVGCDFNNEPRFNSSTGSETRDTVGDPYESEYERDPVVTDTGDTYEYYEPYTYEDHDEPEPLSTGSVRTAEEIERNYTYVPPTGETTTTTTTLPSQTYVIQRNDTLWAISTRFLGRGNRWREIVAANPGLDPRKLRIGQEIVLPAR